LSTFTDSEVIHENLSAAGIIIKEADQEILNYIGNTAYGSSGGLILNENGDILGVNFGFFNDETENSDSNKDLDKDQKFRSDYDPYMFDVEVTEGTDDRDQVKNRNIAVNFYHGTI
jgi:hypothetical protein